MTTAPDPQTVREIARTVIGYAIRDHLVQAAIAEHGISADNVYTWSETYDAVLDVLAVGVQEPDEQPQDERDPLSAQLVGRFRTRIDSNWFRELNGLAEVDVLAEDLRDLVTLAEAGLKAAANAAAQDEQDGDVRVAAEVVAASGATWVATEAAIHKLHKRFAPQIAALEARDAKGAGE